MFVGLLGNVVITTWIQRKGLWLEYVSLPLMRILCMYICMYVCVCERAWAHAWSVTMYWILALQGREAFVCQPAQSKLLSKLQPSDSSSTCCFFHPHHFPFLSDFPAAILCNFVVSSRREFLRWLWSERAGQSHSLPQIGARCHQGSRSDGERCLGCLRALVRGYIYISLWSS